MSTHNIGFYEEISKIINYKISSNTHLFFFCWLNLIDLLFFHIYSIFFKEEFYQSMKL